MERVQNVVKTVESHDSIERYTELGVGDVVIGETINVSAWEAEVKTAEGIKTISTRSNVIVAGAFVPPISGINRIELLTSDNLWNLRERTDHLLVPGVGSIG
ncbi:MAG: hypothetical protein ACU833_15395 [Gammaproteobacteria bacterium]